jgi:hypothetical protein
VPEPSDEADLAATTIGQGRVLVSPLDLAMVAAAVDSGQARAARLVAGAPDDAAAPERLPAAVVRDLDTMMAQDVASGHPLPQDAWLMASTATLPSRWWWSTAARAARPTGRTWPSSLIW